MQKRGHRKSRQNEKQVECRFKEDTELRIIKSAKCFVRLSDFGKE